MNLNKENIIRLAIMILAFSLIFAFFLQIKVKQDTKIKDNEEGGSQSMYLSEMEWESATEEPLLDVLNDEEAIKLKNNNRKSIEFDKGIITKAGSEMTYDLSNLDYNYLTTWVGVRDESDNGGSLQFQVFIDDVLIYESKTGNEALDHNKVMEHVTVDISGANILKLVTKDINESATDSTHGYWADIFLHKDDPLKSDTKEVKAYEGMKLIFNDEFDDDELDPEKWQLSKMPENGSHEYANVIGKDENIWIEDGNLMIQAKKYEGTDTYKTTSGSIMTEDLFDFRYGRVDVRAKIPSETGMWPAIWMMPAHADYGWPMAGEIDIMELISQEPNKIYSTLHSGVYQTPQYYNSGGTLRIEQGTFNDAYHVYSMVWNPGVISFYVDDELVGELSDWQNWIKEEGSDQNIERDYPTPFDKNFYLKLNLATGGGWAEDVDDTTRYGDLTTLKFDYVRVYQEEAPHYNYKTDEPFSNKKQGAVWYAQKYNGEVWENYEAYDSEANQWGAKDSDTEEDSLAYVSRDGISANFDKNSNYTASAIGFRAPYEGYVKVSLQDNVALSSASEVTFTITKGDMTTTQSGTLRTEVITDQSAELSKVQTYIKVEADDMIRFEILKSENEVSNFEPVVEYIDQAEYESSNE